MSCAPRPAALSLEPLEARDVPSTVDLTFRGATGSVNGALFAQSRTQPSGTGVIDSFVRVTSPGNGTVEQGYNTSARPLAYDENNSPNFTRTLKVADVPSVTIGGVKYREFLLDINQKASASRLSLDALKIFISNNAAVSGKLVGGTNLPDGTPGGAAARYDLDAGGDSLVKLDARLSTGSGSSDMIVDVPEALLAGGNYLYLYSKFGTTIAANGGFEEWATRGKGGGAVPPPVVGVTVTGTINYCPFANMDIMIPLPQGTVVNVTNFATGEPVGSFAVGADGSFTLTGVELNTVYTLDAGPFTVTLPDGTVLQGVLTSDRVTFTTTAAVELCVGAGGG